MIEQDIALLSERIALHNPVWVRTAARAELRALGLDPEALLREALAKASLDSGTPDQVGGDGDGDEPAAEADAPDIRADESDAGESGEGSRTPDQVRGDDRGEGSGIPDRVRDDENGDESEGLTAALPAAPERAGRHNEWNRKKMVGFLVELAACHNVSQAARSVGMGRQSAYKLRNRMEGTPFALAWEAALETGLQTLAHTLLDRALNGEEVPHYYQGELVGTSRKYDNRLGAWLLENPGKLGREPQIRPTAAREWEALLERIKTDSHHWYEGETLLCAPSWLQALDDEDEGEAGGEGDGAEGGTES